MVFNILCGIRRSEGNARVITMSHTHRPTQKHIFIFLYSHPVLLIFSACIYVCSYLSYSKCPRQFHSSSSHPLIYLSTHTHTPSPSLLLCTMHPNDPPKPVKGVCGLDSLVLILFASLPFTMEKPRTLAVSAVDCGICKDHMAHTVLMELL